MKNNKPKFTSDIAFTPSVKAIQEKFHSRNSYATMEKFGGWKSEITEQLTHFLNSMDSFYLSTSNSSRQPYTQHRGGPKGFLKKIDSKTLAFADFSGNRQYITTGNLSENDKELLESLSDPSYKARLERVIVFTVEAWDVNCRQHIQQRFTQEDIKSITDPLENKIAELHTK